MGGGWWWRLVEEFGGGGHLDLRLGMARQLCSTGKHVHREDELNLKAQKLIEKSVRTEKGRT